MGNVLEKYATKMFSSEEVRSKLAEVITDQSLVSDLENWYSSSHDHIRRVLLGPHEGDDWEEWRGFVESGKYDDEFLIDEAARVLWNYPESDFNDDELDAQRAAVAIHALMWGYGDRWYELVLIFETAVETDPRYCSLLEDVLNSSQGETVTRNIFEDLSSDRDPDKIKRLFSVVERYAKAGDREACRVLRFWSYALGDSEATRYWALRETGRTSYR